MAVLTLQGRMALQLVGISVTVVCVFLRFWVQRFSKSTGRRAITPANLAGDLLLGLVLLIAVTNVTLEVYICLFLLQNTPPVPPEIPSLEWEKTVMEYQAKMLDFTKMSKKIEFLAVVSVSVVLWLMKGVILTIYIDIAKCLSKLHRRLLFISAGVVAVTGVGIVLSTFLWCRPLESAWALEPSTKCTAITQPAYHYLVFSLHIFTDLLILTFGILIMRNLQLSTRRQKTAVYFVLFLGLLTIIAAIAGFPLRLKFLSSLKPGTPQQVTKDAGGRLVIFSIIEQILAIVTCCVPSLRVLVRRWVDNDSSTSGKGPGSGSKSYGFDGSRGSSRKAFIFGGRSRGSDSESSEMGSRTAPGGIVREDKVSWTEHKVCPVHGEP